MGFQSGRRSVYSDEQRWDILCSFLLQETAVALWIVIHGTTFFDTTDHTCMK